MVSAWLSAVGPQHDAVAFCSLLSQLLASKEPREESVQRVVVTGLGAITPVGLSYDESWCNLRAGVSGVDRMTTVDPEGLDVQIAAEVKHFDPRDFMDVKAARRMDRFAQLAVAAAGQALQDAGLEVTSEESERIGVMLNTGGGGIQTLAREALHYHEGGPARVSPFTIPMITPNMAACQVSIAYGIHGPVMASVAACAAGDRLHLRPWHRYPLQRLCRDGRHQGRLRG